MVLDSEQEIEDLDVYLGASLANLSCHIRITHMGSSIQSILVVARTGAFFSASHLHCPLSTQSVDQNASFYSTVFGLGTFSLF